MIGIALENLSRQFPSVRALDGLKVSFTPGQLHGLIGPDGAGKTTLMRLMAGLLHADGGKIVYSFEGKQACFEEVRPKIGYMPSRPSLYPDLSINEHLEFFKDLYQLPAALYKERRARLLAITRLESFIGRPVGKLSGGMYKKTALMCTLLRSPALLLLDEPTNGVDPISRREFWELLSTLIADKITVIVSTTYMDEANRCCKVHFIDSGRLLLSGEPGLLMNEARAESFDEIFLRGAAK
jgi:ABC-2 type transport system ATP-binding protein